jgi:beta-lactamase regulating signal transducer with metallopeptidase domain
MSLLPFVMDAGRAALVLGAALAALRFLRRAPASVRRAVLVSAFLAVLALPAAARVLAGSRAFVDVPVVVHAAVDPASTAGHDELAALASAAQAPVAVATAPAFRPSLAQLVVAVWALGALVAIARLVASIVRARGLVARAVETRRRGVRVLVSDEIDAPATTGIFAPVVLVPRAALGWSRGRWRVVLSHELAHVRARDCMVNIVVHIARALHWFDPLVWIAGRRLRRERELAADERVLSVGARASDYAEHLIAIAAGSAPPGVVAMAEGRSELALRVEAIVRAGPRPSRPSAPALGTAILGLALAAACTGASPDVKSAAQPRGTLDAEVASAAGGPAESVELTIDPALQRILDDEMPSVASEWRASSATALILDPGTGAILALYDPAATSRAYVTGSTLKAVTIAAALDVGAVRADDHFDCRAYGKLRDATSNGTLALPEILAVSSNIGTAHVFERLGSARLGAYLARFHFGEASQVQLRGVAPGSVPARIDDGEAGAVVAIGERATATPFQIAAAYAAIANGGEYVAPTLVRRNPPVRERVLGPDAARTMMTMLEGVVASGTGKAARVRGARVAGKTGTAEYEVSGAMRRYVSFVGIVPADAPRYVILAGIETPRDDASGGNAAAPVFARIATRTLSK